jgi:hypothetical protein
LARGVWGITPGWTRGPVASPPALRRPMRVASPCARFIGYPPHN